VKHTLPTLIALKDEILEEILARLEQLLGGIIANGRPERIQAEEDTLCELIQLLQETRIVLNPTSLLHTTTPFYSDVGYT
jgi:hypothetical protein